MLLPDMLTFELGQLQSEALLLREQLVAVGERIEGLTKDQPIPAPRGVGALTWLTLLVEMIRWDRFENRRQVASYCGLCPTEYSSGATRLQGSIDKHGNPRLRHVLIQAVWRLAALATGVSADATADRELAGPLPAKGCGRCRPPAGD